MRRALPWILMLVFVGLGLAVFLEARSDPPEEEDLDRTTTERTEPRLRGMASQFDSAGRKNPDAGARDASGSGDPAAVLAPFVLEGNTRFQRRLSAGGELYRVRTELEAERLGAAAASARLTELAPTLLLHDQMGKLLRSSSGREVGVTDALRFLTDPRRDVGALALRGVDEATDPLGTNLRLRTWTRGGPLSAGAVQGADALIARLDSHARVDSVEGYDVLASPGMGTDVFGDRDFPWPFPAAGYYMQQDDLCVVGTRYGAAFVSLVLKHELVHAWQHRHVPGMSSRFLQEGLAEYLSRLESGDYRLDVPPARIRNELAALLQMLSRMGHVGVSWANVEPAQLLGLRPMDFYKLGHLGYLLGLATVAFLGGETVEQALRAGSENSLAARVREIDWTAFLQFLGEHAAGGDAAQALWIEDGRGDEVRSKSRKRRFLGAVSVLDRLNVKVPPGLSDRRLGQLMQQPRPFPAQDAARLDAVLKALLGGGGRVLFLADATKRMELPFRAVPLLGADGAPALPGTLEADTRQAFVSVLHGAVEAAAKDEGVITGCLRTTVAACDWPSSPTGETLTLQRVPDWVQRAGGAGASLVVCVASWDMQRDAIRAAIARAGKTTPADIDDATLRQVFSGLLADLLDSSGVSPSTVLVVDLADGESDALTLAEAFAEHLGEGANVAYWNPQQNLR